MWVNEERKERKTEKEWRLMKEGMKKTEKDET